MTKCAKCGASNPQGKKFCGECGATLEKKESKDKSAQAEKPQSKGVPIYVLYIIAALAIIIVVVVVMWQSNEAKTKTIETALGLSNPPPQTSPPAHSCGDGICDTNENYVTCSADCAAPAPAIPTGTPQYMEVSHAEIANWNADAAVDGMLLQFKVYDSSGTQIAVSGSLTAELDVTCYNPDTLQDVTATVKTFSGQVAISDFQEMYLKLTGVPIGIVGEVKLPFSDPLRLSQYCISGTLHVHLTVSGRTYSADSAILLP